MVRWLSEIPDQMVQVTASGTVLASEWLNRLPISLIGNGTAVALLVMIFLAVVRGWLVPKSTHDEMLRIHQAQLHAEQARGDQWRLAWETQTKRNEEQGAQLDLVLETARTTNALVGALKEAVADSQPRGPIRGGR